MDKEVRIPEISENVDTGEVVQVLVAEGEEVEKDQPILELETEKAAFEIPSPAQGKVKEITTKPGETVKVGQVVMRMEEKRSGAAAPAQPQKAGPQRQAAAPEPERRTEAHPAMAPAPEKAADPAGGIPASPSIRREARELGVNLAEVRGSGPGGRIVEEDLRAAVRERMGPAASTPRIPQTTQHGPARRPVRTPMAQVRKIVAQRTLQSWTTIPHVTQFDQADITNLESFRKQHAQKVLDAGAKLTITSVLAKIAAAAIRVFPEFNARVDMDSAEILFRESVDIGIAVETDRGLLVPVVRDADKKSILHLAAEIADLARRARERKIGPDELTGGGFSISNLGGIGGTAFTPIIDPDQSAILGISRAAWQPVVNDGQIGPRLILPLSLSYDHRLIDGAAGARFLSWIREALENPLLLELENGPRSR